MEGSLRIGEKSVNSTAAGRALDLGSLEWIKSVNSRPWPPVESQRFGTFFASSADIQIERSLSSDSVGGRHTRVHTYERIGVHISSGAAQHDSIATENALFISGKLVHFLCVCEIAVEDNGHWRFTSLVKSNKGCAIDLEFVPADANANVRKSSKQALLSSHNIETIVGKFSGTIHMESEDTRTYVRVTSVTGFAESRS